MNDGSTIILSRKNVASLLTYEDCISAVEKAFLLHGQGKASPPGVLSIHAEAGGYHIKAGLLNLGMHYFVAKSNGNFPANKKNFGLPTIQGVVVVSDADNGQLLALMDSIEITILRTGAATAVAAKYLSKPDAKTATIVGCGEQGRVSIRMLRKVRPIEKVFVYDKDPAIAEDFAIEFSRELSLEVTAVDTLKEAVGKSDICVTCTTSNEPFLKAEYISPGTFIAAVGADNEDKQELEPELLASSKLVTDLITQSAVIGELHHAINKGILRKEDVYAELGEIIAGFKVGRDSTNEVIVFDSTGMALQDVASAAVVFENALDRKIGLRFNFNE